MADFCRQCALCILGIDDSDLAGQCAPGDTTEALCEGCGEIIIIDHVGNRVSSDDFTPQPKPH